MSENNKVERRFAAVKMQYKQCVENFCETFQLPTFRVGKNVANVVTENYSKPFKKCQNERRKANTNSDANIAIRNSQLLMESWQKEMRVTQEDEFARRFGRM